MRTEGLRGLPHWLRQCGEESEQRLVLSLRRSSCARRVSCCEWNMGGFALFYVIATYFVITWTVFLALQVCSGG